MAAIKTGRPRKATKAKAKKDMRIYVLPSNHSNAERVEELTGKSIAVVANRAIEQIAEDAELAGISEPGTLLLSQIGIKKQQRTTN